MAEHTQQRPVADNEAVATATMLRGSPQKLNLVAASIRGMKVEKALASLTFNRRRMSIEVKKLLQSAVANAENNHNLDVDNLIVAEASVGKSLSMKRFHARARGRSSQIVKPFSRLRIVVREVKETA